MNLAIILRFLKKTGRRNVEAKVQGQPTIRVLCVSTPDHVDARQSAWRDDQCRDDDDLDDLDDDFNVKMSSPSHSILPLSSSPPKRPDIEPTASSRSAHRSWTGSTGGDEPASLHLRHSPTLTRQHDPHDPEAQERQRTMDVDSAMQLSRARSASVAVPPAGLSSFLQAQKLTESPSDTPRRLSMEDQPGFSAFLDSHEEEENRQQFERSVTEMQHLSQAHEPALLMSMEPPMPSAAPNGLPVYQPSSTAYRSSFDFSLMEVFAEDEKQKLGLSSPKDPPASLISPPLQATHPNESVPKVDLQLPQDMFIPADANGASNGTATPDSSSTRMRQRRLSSSNPTRPNRRRQGGKMALFEGNVGAPPPTFGRPSGLGQPAWMSSNAAVNTENNGPHQLPPPLYTPAATDRPYRFSFYSNTHPSTIHARSLSELPAEGQSFEDLFCGVGSSCDHTDRDETRASSSKTRAPDAPGSRRLNSRPGNEDVCTWWLDILSPTDEEMKLLSTVRLHLAFPQKLLIFISASRYSPSILLQLRTFRWKKYVKRSSFSAIIILSVSAASTRIHTAPHISNHSICILSYSAKAFYL